MVSAVQIQAQTTKRGIYETCDFRGLSADGRYAFILKHTIFKPWLGKGIITVAVMCFDRQTRKTHSFAEQEELSLHLEQQLKQAISWDDCTFSFATGSFFVINRELMRGKIHTNQGAISWHWQLQRQDEVLQQLPPALCYELPWPRHKVQVRDCFLRYHGKMQCVGLSLSGTFSGSSHHYWGDGYPVEYAAAQANHFLEDKDAFFYGFSSRLSVAKLFTSPYLSMASLKVRGRWYNFNSVLQSARHQVEALDNYRWRMTFLSADYGLELDVDGSNPRLKAWAAWHAEQPFGERAVVKVSPFASATLSLYQRRTMALLAELSTEDMELKTLLPENVAENSGFLAVP